MNEEPMNTACLDGNLAIFRRDPAEDPVNLDPEHSILHAEVLGLELVEVQWGSLGPVGTVDQFTQVLGDGAFDGVSVGLTEKKASSGRGLQEFSCQEAAKPLLFIQLIPSVSEMLKT